MKVQGSLVLLAMLSVRAAAAQSTIDLPVLKGLATVTVLSQTEQGRAALSANYDVTGAIQNGTMLLPSQLTLQEQQQQALRDATSTTRNLAQLADGLGSTLNAAYVARAHNNAQGQALSISPEMQQIVAYALTVSGVDSNAGKYLFANMTTDGHRPVPPEMKALMTAIHGETDPFGRAYHLPAGSANANPFGDSRPFQTESKVFVISGRDYANLQSTSTSYQRGPAMDLTQSPSYPSGHTTYGYTGALLLGILVPERYPEMIVRGAEYGSSRILVGAHYAMDVLGGRTIALYDLAHLLANDPAYLRRHTRSTTTIQDFRKELSTVRGQLNTVLSTNCGDTVQACARMDSGRFNDPALNRQYYSATQTYSFPVVFTATAAKTEDVSRIAPEAGYLLTAAYPSLTLKEADDVLTATEGPGGGFLDDGSAFGLYSRLNLYDAAVPRTGDGSAAPRCRPVSGSSNGSVARGASAVCASLPSCDDLARS